jgi:hypothetical protein
MSNVSFSVVPGQNDRINIHVNFREEVGSLFGMDEPKEINADISQVKQYGCRLWGAILYFFGYASELILMKKDLLGKNTIEKVYINTNSIFKHLVDSWVEVHGHRDVSNRELDKKNGLNTKKIHYNSDLEKAKIDMQDLIKKDKELDKKQINQEKLIQIFQECNMKYMSGSMFGRAFDPVEILF